MGQAASTIVVATASELVGALTPANAGRRILVRAGTYDIDRPLNVPDGVTLAGEGVMQVDAVGRPVGLTTSPRTTLRMTTNAAGDMLSLGNGATIRGLRIIDLPGRRGNVVAVVSRSAGDRLSAAVIESEIVNPNAAGIGPDGPTGHTVVVATHNPGRTPHADAAITVALDRAVIRAPGGGGGVFAFNFAARGRVSVSIARSVIGGGISASGGVSRPDAVHDAEVTIQSHDTLYRDDRSNACAAPAPGWNLTGGAGPPAPLVVGTTARNELRVISVGDRIEGFTTGILGTGSRRFFAAPTAGPSSDNRLELQLVQTTIITPTCGGATVVRDLDLAGATTASPSLLPGTGSTVRLLMRGVSGSGARANSYAHTRTAEGTLAGAARSGNRLEVIGSPQAFARTNRHIDPAPPADFYRSAQ